VGRWFCRASFRHQIVLLCCVSNSLALRPLRAARRTCGKDDVWQRFDFADFCSGRCHYRHYRRFGGKNIHQNEQLRETTDVKPGLSNISWGICLQHWDIQNRFTWLNVQSSQDSDIPPLILSGVHWKPGSSIQLRTGSLDVFTACGLST